jgi:competence protein ComEC
MGTTRALTLRPGKARWACGPWVQRWRLGSRRVVRPIGLRWITAQWDAAIRSPPLSRIGRLVTAIAEAERGRFVLWLPVFMGAGVLAYYGLRTEPPAWIGAKFAAGGFAAALALPDRQTLRGIGLVLGFTALGFASAQYATARLPPIEADLPAKAIMATGTVRAVEILSYARRITLSGATLTEAPRPLVRGSRRHMQPDDPPSPDPASTHLTRTVRIRLRTGDDTPVETGDTIRIRAMARPPLPPALPGGWDTQRDAFFAGLGASGYALGQVEVIGRTAPNGIASHIQKLREAIAARVTAVIPGAAGEVSVTLLTGLSRGIPEADHAAFRASGLAHLLAVAGLHIGIVMAFALGAARTLMALSERASLFWPAKKLAVVFALCVGGGYMVLTGAHVPIVRSFAMASLLTLAILAGRQPVSVRGLGLAGIAMMLIAPYEVPGVSFQMSFSAVLALISGYETLRPRLRRLYGKSLANRLLSYVAALALTSTLAGTASLPYGAYHFGHVQIYYILSNMVAVPVTALWVMPAGMLALLLMPFGLDWLTLVPMGWGAQLLIAIARFTAALPNATLAVPHMPAWGLAGLSFGIAWVGIWRSRFRLLGIGAIAVGILSPMFDRPPDILLSANAGLIGFRTGQGVFLQQTRTGSDFTRDAWFTRWDVSAAAPLPAKGMAATGALNCEPDGCLFRPRDGVMPALLVRGPSRPAGCSSAAVLVSAEPARGACAWPPPPLADRFTVWRDGSVAIWLGPQGAYVLTDREDRGERPWVPPPPKPKPRAASTLPMAPVDR